MGPGKPWNKGGEKDGAITAPALSGPEDGQGARFGKDHSAKAGEIQEKEVRKKEPVFSADGCVMRCVESLELQKVARTIGPARTREVAVTKTRE
jgi:hypothetical protein